MKLIIVCGNEECRQEYNTDTKDRYWECPHCGRTRENEFYPFLTARFMQSRIDGARADWETLHMELTNKADVKVQEKNIRIRRLEGDLGIPDDEKHPDAVALMGALMKEDEEKSDLGWRERVEAFLKEARKIIIAQEERIEQLEEVKRERRKRASSGSATTGDASEGS